MLRTAGRLGLAFLLAVLATAVLGSIVQTQFNLSRLAALGAPITAGVRATTTLQDIAFFGPVMAAIAAAAFLPAFSVAWFVSRVLAPARLAVFALAGVASLWMAFRLMGFFTPMPTLVAAARTPDGVWALAATGLVGGALFAFATRRRAGPVAAAI